ncbi:SagB/ThcOx family dehydrogenase [Lacisediminimonas profundi]|uniref:SagB/ThcOx family dehydrogenase n=1 Tax=Lacisediminimonas profundi TaxID=2603856 RepID=UPI001F4F2C54|nr:SagB/ThcOx family dehydrogenase [Lacisediminimonas profundi]
MLTPTASSLPGRPALLALVLMLPLALALAGGALAAPKSIRLPEPQTTGGKPLMQVLKERRTARDFKGDPLPPQTLSNLLWAAFGVNRPASGGRTAPSAHDVQEIDVYVVLPDGAYLYDARGNALELVRAGDLRGLTGMQPFVKDAPVSLVYVSDYRKFTRDSEADKAFYSAADAGHISQNVYLFGASEGLAVMVRAYIDKPALAKALGLKPYQHIVLAQSVGYPK